MEVVGIFLCAGVVGYAVLTLSYFLRTRLEGSTFDELLPWTLILGFLALGAGYLFAPWLGAKMALSTPWVATHFGVSLAFPKGGLLDGLSWRDVDAFWMSAPASMGLAIFIDILWLVQVAFRTGAIRGILVAAKNLSRFDLVEEEGDAFEKFRMDATTKRKQILVTLTNRRIYYGQPTFEPRHPKKLETHGAFRQLQMEPILSGYRDGKKRQVHLTDVHPRNRDNPSILEIPYDKIVSLQTVDPAFLFKNSKKEPEIEALLFAHVPVDKTPIKKKKAN